MEEKKVDATNGNCYNFKKMFLISCYYYYYYYYYCYNFFF